MLKLMKYEFKKQMFSKIIIAAILGVLTLYFGIACVIDKETHAAIATMLIFTVMVFAGLYTAVESLSVYDKDLKTKQSYMLFLVPRSSYEILGAKMISAVLQIFFTMLIYGIVAVLCGSVFLIKYSSVRELMTLVQNILEINYSVRVDWGFVVQTILTVFVTWVFIVVLGYFVEKAGNLSMGICLHMSFNAVGVLSGGLALGGNGPMQFFCILFGSMVATYLGILLLNKNAKNMA